jgi:hypothetical protein
MAKTAKSEANHFESKHKVCLEEGKCSFDYEFRADLVNLTQSICRYDIGQ